MKKSLESFGDEDKIKLLERGILKDPKDMNIKFSLAILYHAKKEYEKAEKLYKEIIAVKPHSSKALFYLGASLKKQKKYAEALSYFEEYIKIKTNDAKVKELIDSLKAKLPK